jgi:hypothetical protein
MINLPNHNRTYDRVRRDDVAQVVSRTAKASLIATDKFTLYESKTLWSLYNERLGIRVGWLPKEYVGEVILKESGTV